MKVWITKYALTEGVIEADAEIRDSGMILVKPKTPGYLTAYFHGRDWHGTEAEALERAEQMRAAKIASLRKSIAKLEKLSFSAKSEAA